MEIWLTLNFKKVEKVWGFFGVVCSFVWCFVLVVFLFFEIKNTAIFLQEILHLVESFWKTLMLRKIEGDFILSGGSHKQ